MAFLVSAKNVLAPPRGDVMIGTTIQKTFGSETRAKAEVAFLFGLGIHARIWRNHRGTWIVEYTSYLSA